MALYSFGLLCFTMSLMVAVVSGTSPFYSRPLASVSGAGNRGDSIFNRYYENAAAHSMQAESCPVSGAHEVCHTADLESDFQVHICPTDGSACDQNVCYYTSVPPCCLDASTGLECKSVTTLLIEGKTFNVTHYQIPLADNQTCVSISPAVEICDEACTLPCATFECPQNLECDSNGENCQCKEGFTEESECCDCEEGYYQNGTSCIKFCRENCRTRVGFDENRQPIGGCTSCFNGYEPPTCCNCSSDRVEVDGRICKCSANLKPDDTCAEGALEPDCCECDTIGNVTHAFYKNESGECIPFCKSNCAVIGSSGCTTCKTGFMTEPECCQCVPGRTEVNGVCKCDANLKPDGTCAEGALEPDCCECDTTGNATHAFYKNESGECIPFCKSNCAVIGDNGCTTCNDGFGPEPDCCQCEEGLDEINGECKCIVNTFPNGSCIVGAQAQNCCLCITGYQKNPDTGKCEPVDCDKQQRLYFYVDATDSNTFENFCPLIVVMQMLVAAFNPSSTSGTKINAILFPDIPRSMGPSPVFNSSATCLEAVQGQNGGLRLLLSEYGICLDNDRDYFSEAFPSSCGEGTSAVLGLEKIYDIASSGISSIESAVLMLTDGIIQDNSTNLTNVLENLKSVGVHTLIAAGINDGTSMANRDNLLNYTSDDNIVIKEDPVELGIAIVSRMKERGIICKEHADNITASLENAQTDEITLPTGPIVPTLSLFCNCHREDYESNSNCAERTFKYPTCGGDLSIGVPLIPTQEPELDSMILEEEILAAVETVLEKFEG